MLNKPILFFGLGIVLLGLITFLGTRAYVIDQAPKRVMASIEARIAKGAGGWNACNHNRIYGPRPNSARRANPDSVITSMAYDLSNGPVAVSGVIWPDYWSLSLYAQNSDNFFVVNDRQLSSPTFDFTIKLEEQSGAGTSSTELISPTTKGIMLIRRFVKKEADMPLVIENQNAMACGPSST